MGTEHGRPRVDRASTVRGVCPERLGGVTNAAKSKVFQARWGVGQGVARGVLKRSSKGTIGTIE